MTNPYDQNTEVSSVLVKIVKTLHEVSSVSEELKAPHISESLLDLHNRLLIVRARQGQVSEVVGNLIMIQSKARKLVLDRRSDLVSAEAKATALTKQPFVEDFSSGKERNAKLMAKTLDESIALTAAEKLQVDADATLSYAQNIYRELGNQAYDVNTRIKVLGMEGTLG